MLDELPRVKQSPDGIKFRSKLELVNYLGDSWDLTEFNFRLGKTLHRAHKGKRKTLKSSIEKHRTGMEPLSSSAGMEESWPNVKKEKQAGEKLASVVDLTEEEPSSPSSAPSLKYTFDSERSLLKVNRDNVSMSESDQTSPVSHGVRLASRIRSLFDRVTSVIAAQKFQNLGVCEIVCEMREIR
uniref:MBD domain-containing protein n=1 Tax=Timema genevievae TaxID=629358 RepID=A0A7R9K648_TIMGE|nr:unnamed protein product [Timema genevievae]